MKLDKHIYIDEDQNNQVLEYAKKSGIGYSEMMCKKIHNLNAPEESNDNSYSHFIYTFLFIYVKY